jgi:hypothetical protein
VLAYHGCDQAAAQALLSGSAFLLSNKPYDWLGSGAYFWEGDILRAYQWALEHRSASPCVVGTVIELGSCLDLTTQSGISAVREAYAAYVALQNRTGQPIPKNEDAKSGKPGDIVLRYLDRAVINHLHDSYAGASKGTQGRVTEFDTVRALFPEGDRLYSNSGFLEKTHIQIAVRKPKQVLGVFRVPAYRLAELKIPDLYNF